MRAPSADAGERDASPSDGGSFDVGLVDFGAFDLGSADAGADVDFGRVDLGSVDLGSADLGSVDLGRDSGPVDLGTDLGPPDLGRDLGPDLGPPLSGATVSFPAVGDSWTRAGEYLWEAGTSVQGTRSVALATISRVTISAVISMNSLSCDGQEMRAVVDGRVAGTFTINPGDTVVTAGFTFASGAVIGGTVTLRYENAREVASGCGSALFDKLASTITLAP